MARRKHIPALSADKLELALQQLPSAGLPQAAADQLAEMLKAAANPRAEAVDVLIAGLEQQRQAQIAETAKILTQFTSGVVKRGKQGLLEMSQAEFDRLVKEANGE